MCAGKIGWVQKKDLFTKYRERHKGILESVIVFESRELFEAYLLLSLPHLVVKKQRFRINRDI
jgi:hypothetical protein